MKIASFRESDGHAKYTLKQDYKYVGDDYWDWGIWVEASEEALDEIDRVVYNLHYTFREPVQTVRTRDNKFRLDNSGYGTFTVYARIALKDDSVVDLEHELELYYPEGEEKV